MSMTLKDIRYAARKLRSSKGFTVIAVLTLALGIGANTAMFSIINSVMLRPLPFDNPDRLVRVWSTNKGLVTGPSPVDTKDFANFSSTLDGLVPYDIWRKNVSGMAGDIQAEQLAVGLVPAEYFQILGIQPLIGRFFTAEEQQQGKHFVAALNYSFWQSHFNGDKSVLGKTIRVNNEPYTIVAVMPDVIPEWMEIPHKPPQVWTPFVPYPGIWEADHRADRNFSVLGRLKAGVTLQQAKADLERIAGTLSQQYPLDRGWGVDIERLSDTRVGNLRPVLILLMGAVALILLIACANLANLLLARNSFRYREIAVQTALGASRWVLIRQLLTETLLMAFMGGILGIGLAWVGCRTLERVHPSKLPQLSSVTMDVRVLLFALGLSLLTSLLFGVLPSLSATRVNLANALKDSGRSATSSSSRQYGRRLLAVAEMAFAVMLLITAGLVIQSLLKFQLQQPGFQADHLLTAHLFLPGNRYPDSGKITQFATEMQQRVQALPGVQEASIASEPGLPDPGYTVNGWSQNFTLPGHPPTSIEDVPSARFGVSDSHYIRVTRIPLLKGRDFSDSDTETAPKVALINQEFVRRYFSNEDPLGKEIDVGVPARLLGTAPSPTDQIPMKIIGVIGNVKNRGLAQPSSPEILALFRQVPDFNYGFKFILVRTKVEPSALISAVRDQLHQVDPDLPLASATTVEEMISLQAGNSRFNAILLGLFAGIGSVLAIIGVYGVTSYLVAQRTQEIAVRIALGAQHGSISWLVIKQGVLIGAVGAVLGMIGAFILRQGVAQLVYGISPVDPGTFIGAALLLLSFGVLAGIIPVTRALRVSPVVALHEG
ncbi:MAG TPA: ABC transporter permease [Candidatus Angelobacter sp.]|nr:ABC transporter permease [Candidatus Angelobacter sp.]